MRGRPKQGKEVKKQVCVRLQPRDKKLLTRHFGSVQKCLDFIIRSVRTNLDDQE